MNKYTAFAVIEVSPGRFQPSRVEVSGGQILMVMPLREAMPYKPLAYEYLQGEVRMYYAGLWKTERAERHAQARAQAEAEPAEVKRGPGRPKKGTK